MLTMKQRTVPFLIAAIAAAVCLLLACVCTGCSGSDQNVAAKFGDHTISEDEVTSYTDDFRAQNGLADDANWVQYLQGNSLTGKTWREQAVRTLAERVLVEDKAKELGVSANEDDVNSQLSKAKQQAGVAEDDDSAWSEYLSARGTTPDKYRENLEFTSVEQQVLRKELNFDDALEEEMCDDYIKTNLADRVVRRYSAIVLERTDKDKGEQLLNELKRLSGDELESRFAELAQENSTDTESSQIGGDIGWDFTYSEGLVDPKAKVRYSKLKAGELYPKLVKGTTTDGAKVYRIMFCTGVVNFEQTPKFSQLPDENSSTIRSVVEQLTLATKWAGKCQEYLENLVNDANIQVAEMPSGLSYDLVEDSGSSSSSSEDSSAQASESSASSEESSN